MWSRGHCCQLCYATKLHRTMNLRALIAMCLCAGAQGAVVEECTVDQFLAEMAKVLTSFGGDTHYRALYAINAGTAPFDGDAAVMKSCEEILRDGEQIVVKAGDRIDAKNWRPRSVGLRSPGGELRRSSQGWGIRYTASLSSPFSTLVTSSQKMDLLVTSDLVYRACGRAASWTS
jgi:hypothetical protein